MYTQSSKINVLHIVHSFKIGGMENGVVNLINRSDKNTFNHEICCITRSGSAEKRLKRHINIYEMDKQEGNDWRLIFKIKKLLARRQPDIVHTRSWGSIEGIIAAKIAGIPTVIHGEHGWSINDPYGQSIKRQFARKALSFGISRYVTVSEDIKRWLIDSIGVERGKIIKIVNGVDTTKFSPTGRGSPHPPFRLKNEVIIGTVGRLDPIKRQDLLLKAFFDLDYQSYNLRLMIIGDGPECARLHAIREKFPDPERIMLLGRRDNVHEFYKLMDIFVLPSKNEGMSNTIIEGMATGLPVIATAVGGNPELVTHAKTGFLIPADDCKAICEAINYYLNHPEVRKQQGENGRLEVEKRFSLSNMITNYEELYKSLYVQNRKSKIYVTKA